MLLPSLQAVILMPLLWHSIEPPEFSSTGFTLPYECVCFLQMFSTWGCLHMAFSQLLLYARVPTFPGNDDSSVQVCPLLVPQCHWRWVCFCFTLTTLYSNIQEPFLQRAVLVFIHLFSVTDVCPCSMCSRVTRAHQIQTVSLLSLL